MKKFILVDSSVERGQYDVINVRVVDDMNAHDALTQNCTEEDYREVCMVAGQDDAVTIDDNIADAAMYGEEWASKSYEVPEDAIEIVIPVNACSIEDCDQELLTVEGFNNTSWSESTEGLKFFETDNVLYMCVRPAVLDD